MEESLPKIVYTTNMTVLLIYVPVDGVIAYDC